MDSQPQILHYASRHDPRLQSRKRRVIKFGAERLLTFGGAVLSIAVFVGLFLLFHRSVLSGIIGAIVGILLIPLIATFVRARQRLGGMRILNYLEQSMRLRLPLPEFLRVAAGNEAGRPARQLRAVSESLGLGLTVGDALRSEVPELPERVGWMLRAAENNGTLPTALTRLTNELDTRVRQTDERSSAMPLTYLVVLCALMLQAFGFVAVFVLPKIAQISADFGIRSVPLFKVSRAFNSPAAQLALLILFLLAVLILLRSIVSSTDTLMGRLAKRYDPLRPIRDRFVWFLPWIGSLMRDSNLSDVCQTLADALHAKRPADQALQEAQQPHLNRVLLMRVERWHLLHRSGQPIGRAAQMAGMPRLVCGMLPDHATKESAAAALEFLAAHYRARALRTRHWLLSAVPTAMTFLFGAIVLGFSYTVYSSVWILIDATAPYKVGL